MTTVAEMMRRLQSLQIKESVVDSIEETKETMLQFNAQQLEQGIRSDGETIHWLKDSHYPYTEPYARSKAKKGFQTTVVDLNATTGKTFYKTEQIKVDGDDIRYESNIKLAEYLEQNYGVKIWGLTSDNKTDYTKGVFFRALKEKIETKTGLQFT
jgi:hypothetical protein